MTAAAGGEAALRLAWPTGLAANPAAPAAVLDRLLAAERRPDEDRWLSARALPAGTVEAALAHPAPAVRRRLADNPHLPPALLGRLALDRDRTVRRACALAAAERQVVLPVEALAALAGDRDANNRRLVPACPGLPADLRAALARDPQPAVRAAAITREGWPQLPAGLRHELTADRDPVVRAAVRLARRTERPLPRTLAEYIAESDPRRRERAAARAPIERRLGEWLRYDDDPWIRTAVAGNPHLPTDLALALAVDPVEQVRLAVSVRPDLTEPQRAAIRISVPDGRTAAPAWVTARHGDPVALAELAASAHPLLRRGAAAAPGLPAEAVRALAADPDPGVRLALAEHCPDAPHELLVELYAGGRGRAHDALAERPNFARPGLARFAGHPDARLRLAALRDPQVAPELVERLTADPDRAVARAAARHPRLPLPALRRLLASELAEAAAANPALPLELMHCLLDLSDVPPAAERPGV
ncbi:hypothetical protein [Kitasatospora terrestris]|uniref:LRV domain-containing protein n=1 Tax=Kitasatospora terrestris TaxID=258051 RepID=A0ABP9EDT7_9ACTN